MSAVLPKSFSSATESTSHRTGMTQWVHEPLLHFLLLGALLFVIDAWVNDPAADQMTIYVDADVDNQAKTIFRTARGREPNEDELYALRRVWLDNEVLYREGLAMGVDKGDSAIRERVIFKALSIVDSNIQLPPVNDQILRDWFEKNRVKYDDPARYDFQEAVLTDHSEAAVRAFVSHLNTGTPGDTEAGLRVFKARPHANLVDSYGEAFAIALEQATVGEWLALRSGERWRAVMLDAITPAKQADFEQLRGVILADWRDATASEQRSAAVQQLARKYTIKVEEPL